MSETISPEISIVIPVYNAENYLEKCLESIEAQSYQDIECILVNDGSTDNSQEIIDNYVAKFPSKYISILQ